MQKLTYLGNIPETVLAKTNPVYRYYIPAIDEHIWVCRDCRLKYWESILRKKWRLVDRKSEGEHYCMACSEEKNQSPAADQTQAEMPVMLQEDPLSVSAKAL
jgi:hypothetical protein